MKDPAFALVVSYPRDLPAGQYLQGPRTPGKVRRDGYGFTPDPAKAWTFPSERAATAKAAIVERHMGWGRGVLTTEPAPIRKS